MKIQSVLPLLRQGGVANLDQARVGNDSFELDSVDEWLTESNVFYT